MYIKVRAFPKSKHEDLKEVKEGKFEIRVKEKAERNLANQRIIEMLAQYFKVGEDDIKIINGHHHPSKLISINNIN
ncbi:MAG: DUF167 domain-containing protein [Patescibacteria group bacterium]|nr:DUF167 domain-containing protein [Patescibacteria group bacterium]